MFKKALLVTVLAIIASGGVSADAPTGVQADTLGVSHTPLRIISLAPATTEILFALGLDSEIVGVSSFCNYPPQALAKEKVGTFSSPNAEVIVSLKPDVVVGTGLEQASAIEMLRGLGLTVNVSDPVNMTELFVSIREIAALCDKVREGEALIQKMQADIDQVQRHMDQRGTAKKKVFVEIWGDPLTTAGARTFIDELILLSGGENIAHDVVKQYAHFSPEQVIARDPDVIIMPSMAGTVDPVAIVASRPGWDTISAVKNKCVYNDISSDIILRPGPRLAEGLKELYKHLWPHPLPPSPEGEGRRR
jgi:iron complex transport system substrate-binding protein